MINAVFLGPPGSGKGTQARYIHRQYHLHLIGMGDILREEVRRGTSIGRKVKHTIETGAFPDNELIIELLTEHLLPLSQKEGGVVFDGIPRDIYQAKMMDSLLDSLSMVLNFAIYLDVDDETLIQRIMQRCICASCGAVYGKDHASPPEALAVCPVCLGKDFTRREDDERDIFEKRLRLHKEKEAPVLAYYGEKGILLTVDGAQDVLLVQGQVERFFKKRDG